MRLSTFDGGANQITNIQHLQGLRNLEDLWLNDNNISNLEDLKELLPLTKLQTLYLEHNPVAKYDATSGFVHRSHGCCELTRFYKICYL